MQRLPRLAGGSVRSVQVKAQRRRTGSVSLSTKSFPLHRSDSASRCASSPGWFSPPQLQTTQIFLGLDADFRVALAERRQRSSLSRSVTAEVKLAL